MRSRQDLPDPWSQSLQSGEEKNGGGKEGASCICHLGKAMGSGIRDPEKQVQGEEASGHPSFGGLRASTLVHKLPGFKSRPHHSAAEGHLDSGAGSSPVKSGEEHPLLGCQEELFCYDG